MYNNTHSYCYTAEDLFNYVKDLGDKELKTIFITMGMSPDEFIYLLRNNKLRIVSKEKDEEELDAFFRDNFVGFLRDEFGFLNGGENYCTEDQFRNLIVSAKEAQEEATGEKIHLEVLRRWREWFVARINVSNETYETYDFERSENAIIHLVDYLNLPPMQIQYVKYYLMLKHGTPVFFTDFEQELLSEAAKNMILQDKRICKLLDELL